MSLHKPAGQNSYRDSTVAYQINYYPWSRCSLAARERIAWHKTIIMAKQKLLDDLNEDKTMIYLTVDSVPFHLQWAFNNIPTENQWNDLPSGALIRVQFRISGFARDTGRIALLSLVNSGENQLRKEEHL